MKPNTKHELFEYIDTLNVKPGDYSREQLINIGRMHKNLPAGEKSWSDLAKKLGYSRGAESLRQLILRSEKNKADSLPADLPEMLNNPAAYEQEYKEKTLVRDIYNAYRLALRKDARVESFRDSLVAAVNQLEPIILNVPTDYVKNTIGGPEAVLMLSDLHIGVNCENFYNKYNHDVAKIRMAKLATDVIRYCKVMNVNKLHLVNLGDMIHGVIHATARILEEFNVTDQITRAAELISQFIAELCKANINVIYRSCTDNHSRFVANHSDSIEEENFSRIIDWYLEARLKDTSVIFMHDNIDISIGKFILDNGKSIMFAHGHLENLNKCIDAFMGATKSFVDYVLLSHYHASKEKSYNGAKLYVNGSIVGTEDYALSKRLFSPAEQKLLIFDRDNILDININLQ